MQWKIAPDTPATPCGEPKRSSHFSLLKQFAFLTHPIAVFSLIFAESASSHFLCFCFAAFVPKAIKMFKWALNFELIQNKF